MLVDLVFEVGLDGLKLGNSLLEVGLVDIIEEGKDLILWNKANLNFIEQGKNLTFI